MSNDLFEPIAVIPTIDQQVIDDAVRDNPAYHGDYVWMAIREDIRDRVNERWARVQQFCEPNFVAEFRDKEKFYSKFWELNLRYLFADQLTRKPSNSEPDLIADGFVAECVVPDTSGVPGLVFGVLHDYPTDQIGRRATAALVSKLAQFNTRAAKTNSQIDYTATPYIIAVGLPQREFRDAKSMSGMDIVETMLVGAGALQITLDQAKNTGKISVSSRGSMQTRNGTDYGIAYFQRDEWKGVSAVLWSAEWLPEIKDIKILLNPNASIPLMPAALGVKLEIITYTKTDVGYTRDQQLNES